MRRVIVLFAVLLAWPIFGVLSTEAQVAKPRITDPSFSPHNYKHVKKASLARASSKSLRVSTSSPGLAENSTNSLAKPGHYKTQTNAVNPTNASLVLPANRMKTTTNPLRSTANYKRQHVSPAKPQPAPSPVGPMVNSGEEPSTQSPDK